MDTSANTPTPPPFSLLNPSVLPFECAVDTTLIRGTVTFYPTIVSADAHGIYTVDAVVGTTRYKFTIAKTGPVWSTGIVSVYDHGKIESLDAFILNHAKIEQLFEQALVALTQYKDHGVAGIDPDQPIDPTRFPE